MQSIPSLKFSLSFFFFSPSSKFCFQHVVFFRNPYFDQLKQYFYKGTAVVLKMIILHHPTSNLHLKQSTLLKVDPWTSCTYREAVEKLLRGLCRGRQFWEITSCKDMGEAWKKTTLTAKLPYDLHC